MDARTPDSIRAARGELSGALEGLHLDDGERRVVEWLLGWDQPTMLAFASIIRKARAADAV